MFPPIEPDPGWYDRYWYSERPEPKRRSFVNSLARFGVLVAVLVGGGLVLANHHLKNDANSGSHHWEQE